MKRTLTLLIALALALAVLLPAAAEDTTEYRDHVFAFRYPASWSLDTLENGDIVVLSPDTRSAVIAFSTITDLIRFTGDPANDNPLAESTITSYSGKNLSLSGAYELIQSGDRYGFRATGTWLTGSQDAVMVFLSGDRHIMSFVLVGKDAIALEQDLIGSLEFLGGAAPADSAKGFLRWEGDLFAMDYPEHYRSMEQGTAVLFINGENPANIITARAYPLEIDYVDALAPIIAANGLPASTGITPTAEMTEIGGRNAAIIQGTTESGPLSFYAFGSGRTAIVLMLIGEEAAAHAEALVGSVIIK